MKLLTTFIWWPIPPSDTQAIYIFFFFLASVLYKAKEAQQFDPPRGFGVFILASSLWLIKY